MGFYNKNEDLFWVLGISITIISIIFSLNSNIVADFNKDNIWDVEFLNKQYYLNQLYKDGVLKNDIVTKLRKLDANKGENNKSKNIDEVNYDSLPKNRTIILLDNTMSVENDIEKVFNISEKDIKMDFEDNCPENTKFNSVLEYKPNVILGISSINSFIKNSKDDDKIAFLIYNTIDSIEVVENDKIIDRNFYNKSKLNTNDFYDNFLTKLNGIAKKKLKNQKTSFVNILKKINKDYLIENFNYRLIIISDFEDDSDSAKNDFNREINIQLSSLKEKCNKVFCLKLPAKKGASTNEKGKLLDSLFNSHFRFLNYSKKNITKISGFTKKPFSDIEKNRSSNIKSVPFNVYYPYNVNNIGTFAFGYMQTSDEYKINYKNNKINPYNYYLEETSEEIKAKNFKPFNAGFHKMEGVLFDIKNKDNNMFLKPKKRNQQPVVFKRYIDKTILKYLYIAIILFISSIITLIMRFSFFIVPFYRKLIPIIIGLLCFVLIYLIYFNKIEIPSWYLFPIIIVSFIFSTSKNIQET